jgi:large subunit ribosomal protein L29
VKAEKIREMADEELDRKAEELFEQIFRGRLQKATGQLDRPTKIRELRKDLARVKTIIAERRRAEGTSS